MDTKILHKWLKSGYTEKGIFHPTKEGTPQGGIWSPTAANIVLDGMETLIKSISSQPDKVNFVRYADDFIVTGSTKSVLENKIKPAIENFLKERGLELSPEKTKITHIDEGFDFLGFNIRKYNNGKLLIKPVKKNVLLFLDDIRELVKENSAAETVVLIRKMNARIRGWANYYRHHVAKNTFSYVDHCIFKATWNWAKRRHPNKNLGWIRKKYFRRQGLRDWKFFAETKNIEGNATNLDLFHASNVRIIRHVKIRSDANPFDPNYKDYFERRDKSTKVNPRDIGSEIRNLPIF